MRVRTTSPSFPNRRKSLAPETGPERAGRIGSVASSGESFRAGQAPLVLQHAGTGPQVSVEFLQAGVKRTFRVGEGQLWGFASTHPQEQLSGEPREGEAVAVPASALARLVPSPGEYRLVDQEPPGPPLAVPLTAVIVEALRRALDVTPVLELLGSERPFARAVAALPSHLILAPVESFVWERLREAKTLPQLKALLPEQSQALARAFAGLACAGFLQPAEQAPPRPTQAPRFPPANPRLRERLAKIAREGGLEVFAENRELTQEELEKAHEDKEKALALLAQGGDERQAVRLLSRAVSILPDPHSLVRLAEVEVANPMWRERALAHLKQALEMDPKFTPAWLALANYWALRGDTGKQRRCLENILKYEPQNRDVREALMHLA